MPNKIPSSASSSQTSQRLFRLSGAIANCAPQASLYAKCISANIDNIKKDICAKEFNEFKACVQNVVKKK